MSDSETLWDVYWETRLREMENLGKRTAILEASRLIRELAPVSGRRLRLLELGCGEGQVIGALLDAHFRECSREASAAVDYSESSLHICKRDVPGLSCIHGDFSDPGLLSRLLDQAPHTGDESGAGQGPCPGGYDLVLLVNALHEVFSDCTLTGQDQIDVPAAKKRVVQALAGAARCLGPSGWLVLFDGIEPSGNSSEAVRIRFRDIHIRREFDLFTREYRPFPITFRELESPLIVELTTHSFTRYITKSIFLGKGLWESERLQSYQYFTQEEFRSAVGEAGLEIDSLRTLTMNEEKWRYRVEIETPGVSFPNEHVIILAHR